MFDRVVPDYVPSVEAHMLAGSTLELLADRLERAMKAGRLRPADPLATRGAGVGDVSRCRQPRAESTSARPRSMWPDVYNNAMDMIVSGLS